jgi:hypothetical protein
MNGPPRNASARRATGRREKLTDDPFLDAGSPSVNAETVPLPWRREAARLANEYQRTRRERHRLALLCHIHGMRLRLGRSAQ